MSEDTDVFVETSDRQTFFFPETKNCLEIKDVLKFESIEPCKGNNAAFGWLRHQNSNIQFQGRKMLHSLFQVITKRAVSSDKNAPFTQVTS